MGYPTEYRLIPKRGGKTKTAIALLRDQAQRQRNTALSARQRFALAIHIANALPDESGERK